MYEMNSWMSSVWSPSRSNRSTIAAASCGLHSTLRCCSTRTSSLSDSFPLPFSSYRWNMAGGKSTTNHRSRPHTRKAFGVRRTHRTLTEDLARGHPLAGTAPLSQELAAIEERPHELSGSHLTAAVAVEVLEQRGQLLRREAHARRKHASTELLQAQPPVMVHVEVSNDLAATLNRRVRKETGPRTILRCSAGTNLLEVQVVQNVSFCGAFQRLQRLFDRAAELLSELSSAPNKRDLESANTYCDESDQEVRSARTCGACHARPSSTACSLPAPPNGRAQWWLRLAADRDPNTLPACCDLAALGMAVQFRVVRRKSLTTRMVETVRYGTWIVHAMR